MKVPYHQPTKKKNLETPYTKDFGPILKPTNISTISTFYLIANMASDPREAVKQLLSLTQELHSELENKEQVNLVVLDFSEAFDKVAHRRLLSKLHNFGVRENLLKWIASSF